MTVPMAKNAVPKPTKVEHLPGGKQLWYFRDQAELMAYYNSVKKAVQCSITKLGKENCIEF